MLEKEIVGKFIVRSVCEIMVVRSILDVFLEMRHVTVYMSIIALKRKGDDDLM